MKQGYQVYFCRDKWIHVRFLFNYCLKHKYFVDVLFNNTQCSTTHAIIKLNMETYLYKSDFKLYQLSNGLFFFKKSSLITATMCA